VQDQRPSPSAPAVPAPLELARCEEFAKALQAALEEGDLAGLGACIDVTALLEKATSGIEGDPEYRKGFMKGLRETLLPTILRQIHDGLEQGGSLRLLRVRTREGQQRPLFRFLQPGASLEYFEFDLREGADGRVRAVDWHQFGTGEWLSESVHHLYLPLALQNQRGLIDRLFGRDELLARHWKQVMRLVDCVRDSKLEEGLEVYRGLPAEVRHDKLVLLQRMRLAALHSDQEDYLQVLADLRRYCPGDPVNEMTAVDYYRLREQWTQSAEAVRRLREVIEGDPYLDCLEASVLIKAKDLPGARVAIERSVAGEPERLDSHWVLVSVCLKQKDHAGVLGALKHIDELFEVDWNDFTTVDEYKEFAASPLHANWLAHLAAKK